MITRETAGTSSDGTSERSGSCGQGSARGMGAMSPTTATDSSDSTATATVIASSASAIANSLRRVRLSTTTRSTVARPMAVVSTSEAPGCMNRSAASRSLLSYRLEKPVRAPSCESRICTPMPAMRPIITALETKRTSPPALRSPRTSMMAPVSTASVNRPAVRCARRQRRQRAAGREAERGRRDDRHALGAGGERPRRRAGGDGVQAVDRRHAGEHGVRHGVADLGGPYREARDQVVQEAAVRRRAMHRRPARTPAAGPPRPPAA